MNRAQRVAAWIFALLLFLVAFASSMNSYGNEWIALAALLSGMALILLALTSGR